MIVDGLQDIAEELPPTTQATPRAIINAPGMSVPAMEPKDEMNPDAFMPKKLSRVEPQKTARTTAIV